MTQRRPDIAQAHPQSIAFEHRKWDELERLITPEHPRYPEYLRVSTEARATLGRMMMATTMPGGWPMIERGWETVQDLYGRAVEIRGTMAHAGMRQTLGVADPRQSITASFERPLDRLRDNQLLRPAAGDLQKIAAGLDVNPGELMSGQSVPGNLFYQRYRGRIVVNFPQINWARQTLDEIEKTPGLLTVRPELVDTVRRLRAGIDSIAASDPVRSVLNDRKNAVDPQPLATYMPLRVVGAVGGALISGLGLAYAVFGKKEISWPIPLWAGVAAISMRPDLLRGSTYHNLQRIGRYGTEQAQHLMADGFRGETAAQALGELQDIRRTRGGLLRRMQGAQVPLSMAQIGELSGNPQSALVQTFQHLPEADRTAALRLYGRPMSQGEREFVGEYVRVMDRLPAMI